MKTCLLSLLLLTGLGWAEPRFYDAADPAQGSLLLVAENGQDEAESLARAGLSCALSHAQSLEELRADLDWARKQMGTAITVVGIRSRGPLVQRLGGEGLAGRISLDPHPQISAYGSPAADMLYVVAADANEETCKLLGENCHKAAGSLDADNSAAQKEVRRWVAVHQPLPVVGLPDTKFVASPNWGVRSLGDRVDTVVVHSTVINTLEGTERAFLDDKVRRVSAHYVVDRDGTTVQMVDERRTAWHAGVSELEGRTGVNDFSIGIELVNLNDGKDPYPEAQYQAVVRIVQDLRNRWDVPDSRIVSHAFIARPEGRKSDPVGFDFAKLIEMLK